ncbi:cytochrome-c peroxidase [Portibacter lacus]|uniref:Cytochrome-c peroxidase n=1 Tax=Portibacter lacus TaxID=1099794 RepID=A0AA37SQZ3_9BACT|nr:cytochrome c peroxidase [Portibacter lacus]GLR18355.1 cytochrome-c peroxidase [Portibacter lacus]
MNRIVFSIVAVLIIMSSCVKDQMTPVPDLDYKLQALLNKVSPTRTAKYYVVPDRYDLDNIPQDPKNPLTQPKVTLGNMLFFETGIAQASLKDEGLGTYSCSSCHVPEAGFKPGTAQGIADGGSGFGILGEERVRNVNFKESELDVQGARPISMINVAFSENTMWNGKFGSTGTNAGQEDLWELDHELFGNFLGYQGIEAQNIEGMNTHRLLVNKEIADSLGYTELFDQAFPEFSEEERYSNLTASLALSAAIRTIFPNEAPFQKWLKGEQFAMSKDEKRGAILFFDKAGCVNCHKSPGLSAVEYYALGVYDMYQRPSYGTSKDDLRNLGRGGYTKSTEDNFKFKVPQLYNLSDTPFFFHGSSHTDLEQVVRYFNDAVPENPNVPQEQISPLFHPLDMTEDEIKDLTLFLSKSLRDPSLERYYPSSVGSGNCFPNADFQSRMDIGCN